MKNSSKKIGNRAWSRDEKIRSNKANKQIVQKGKSQTKIRACKLNAILIVVLFLVVASSPLIISMVENSREADSSTSNDISSANENNGEIPTKEINTKNPNLIENETIKESKKCSQEKISDSQEHINNENSLITNKDTDIDEKANIGKDSVESLEIDENNKENGKNKISITYHFPSPTTKHKGKYDNVTILDLHNFGNPGLPVLPIKGARILLPQRETIKDIKVETKDKVTLKGDYYIFPGQTPQPISSKFMDWENLKMPYSRDPRNRSIFSKKEYSFTKPNNTIYNSSKPFPKDNFSKLSIQGFRGYGILLLNLYPIEYIPKARKISYFKEMEVIITTKESSNSEINDNFRNLPEDKAKIKKMVDNPDMADNYTMRKKAKDNNGSMRLGGGNPPEIHKYVVITNNELYSTFQDLVDWKNEKNSSLNATIVTVENITNNPDFYGSDPIHNDTATKIRNFIISAHRNKTVNPNYLNWSTEYVLLGGDVEIIPHRGVYGVVNKGSPYETSDQDIPCDLYYGALDGNWDNDNDTIYGEGDSEEGGTGEAGEEADFGAEVYIGRAPVNTKTEAYNFIYKTIAYENMPGQNNKALMVGQKLDDFPTWGGDGKDEIANIFPENYTITKLYDRDNTFSKNAVIDALNNGPHLVNHDGHSNNWAVMELNYIDILELKNNFFFLVYSQGCYSSSFDNRDPWLWNWALDAVGEYFIKSQCGAFAYIGNSRYGWYIRGQIEGPSYDFDEAFFKAIFDENITRIGKALQDSKEDKLPMGATGAWRWCYFDLNLLGDPETSLHVNNSSTDVSLSSNNSLQLIWPRDEESDTIYFNLSISNTGNVNDTYDFEINFPKGVSGEVLNSSTFNGITNITVNSNEVENVKLKVVTDYDIMDIGKQRINFKIISQNYTFSNYNFVSDSIEVAFVAPNEIRYKIECYSGEMNFYNTTILINYKVVVDIDGKLTLNHTAFVANLSFWKIWITPNPTSELYLNNGSIIEAYDPTNTYNFNVENKLDISDSKVCDMNEILISNTNSVTILDSIITNGKQNGIYLSQSDNNIFMNNTCTNNEGSGIYLWDSNNNTIANNTFNSKTKSGITITNCQFNTINNNSCSLNNEDGITLTESSNNSIINNICMGNQQNGIYLSTGSDYNILSNNICNSNHDHGISIYSDFNSITNNSCNLNYKSGIYLYQGSPYISDNYIINNICSLNCNGIFAQFLSNSTLNNNTINSNYDMGICIYGGENVSIDGNNCSKNMYGIYMVCLDGLCFIFNNTFYSNLRGMYITQTTCIINGNLLWTNYYGIEIIISKQCIITNNSLYGYNKNILTDGLLLNFCYECVIANNHFTSYFYGINIHFNYESDANNTISNNICSNNIYGIGVASSNKNRVINNTCTKNYVGLLLWDESEDPPYDNFLSDNIFNFNQGIGIAIYDVGNKCNTINNITCLNNANGIFIYNSTSTISNCTIKNSNESDFCFYNKNDDTSSHLTIINTIFDKNKVNISDLDSDLTVQWYLSVKAINETGAEIPNATVIVRDLNEDEIYNGTTDVYGLVKWILCTEYVESKISKTYYTPHIINASKGEVSTEISEIMFEYKIVIISLIEWGKGDIVVVGKGTYRNRTIILDGNLTIEMGGVLTFFNITIKMNCSTDGQYHIEVKNNGSFYIYDNDNNPITSYDASNITTNNTDYEFLFWVNEGATFEMRNSELHECGYEHESYENYSGLWINTHSTIIDGNLITNNYNGINFIESCNNTIQNCIIENNIRDGINIKGIAKEENTVEEWNKTFGGSNTEIGYSVQQTSDNGFIISGYTNSYGAGDYDFLLVKTDENGNEEWNKTFGGTQEDKAYSVQQTSDGGFIIVGHTQSYGSGYRDTWLIKTDENGTKEWDKTFGGDMYEYGYSVQETSDGGFVIVGLTTTYGVDGSGDVWLIKTDEYGDEQWRKTFGGSNSDGGRSVQETIDSGFIIAGYTQSYGAGGSDVWLIKTNENGNKEWDKTFGGFYDDYAYSVQETSDEGFIIAGYTESYGAGNKDAWIIKTDNNGTEEWNKTFGGYYQDRAYSVRKISNEGYIIAGYTQSWGTGNNDGWLIEINEYGYEKWNKTFGGSNDDVLRCVQVASDNGFIIAGDTKSYGCGNGDSWLIKMKGMFFTSNNTIQYNSIINNKNGVSAQNIINLEIHNNNILNNSEYGISVFETQESVNASYNYWGHLSGPFHPTKNPYGKGDNITDYVEFEPWLEKPFDFEPDTIFVATYGNDSTGDGTEEKPYKTIKKGIEKASYRNIIRVFSGTYYENIIINKTITIIGNCSTSTIIESNSTGDIVIIMADGVEIQGFTIMNGSNDSAGILIKGNYTLVRNNTITNNGDGIKIEGFEYEAIGEEAWNMTFGGFNEDIGRSIQITSDGGFIIAGDTTSYGLGNQDVLLIKTDENGTEEWHKTFGGTQEDRAYSVQQTSDGGFIIVGYTQSYGEGYRDVWLIKTNENGTKEWDKTFGGDWYEYGYCVQETSDGGFVIAGLTTTYGVDGSGDVWLIKTDENGNKEWDRTYGGSESDGGRSVQETSEGGYIITGYTQSYGAGGRDIWFIKTDENGTMELDETFGGSNDDYAFSVQETSEGGYIITGYTQSYGAGAMDVWLIKTDENGTMEWNKTFGGTNDDVAYSVRITSDNGFVIVGYTESYGFEGRDVWLIKTDENGTKEWDKTFGDALDDGAYCVQEVSINVFIINGYTKSYGTGNNDVWLIKTTDTIKLQSHNNKILNCTIINNENGISAENIVNLKIQNCIIQNSNENGIFMYLSEQLTVSNCIISDNNASGISFKEKNEQTEIHNNNILDNKEYGISVFEGQESVYASHNYWGHLSGPFHPVKNPFGKGDNITDYVDFEPWLDKPFNYQQNTIFVAPYGNDSTGNGTEENPYKTIHKGIEEASYGDIIRVFNGTYYGNIIINKTLTIIGNCSTSTIIDSNEIGDVVIIMADDVEIQGFTIRNGSNENAGIYIRGNNTLVWNNIISNNGDGIKIGGMELESTGEELWNRTFGGSYDDIGRSIQITSDGGFIMAGEIKPDFTDEVDGYLIKTNESGEKEWDKSFGNDYINYFNAVQETLDGGFIIVGVTELHPWDCKYAWIIKTGENGTEEWNKTFGSWGEYWYAYSVQEISDGGFIVAGRTYSYVQGNSDVWIIKTDVNGNEIWSHNFGGDDEDGGRSVQITSDGGFIIAGYTESYGTGGKDVWLIKTDENGVENWSSTFGGFYDDYAYSVQETSDGGFIIAGYTESYGAGNKDAWIIKTDKNGTEEWNKTIGGLDQDRSYFIQEIFDGFIIAGYTQSYGAGNSDAWLIKINEYGTVKWIKTFGSANEDVAYCVRETSDNGFVIVGYTKSYGAGNYDVWLIKIIGTTTVQSYNNTVHNCTINNNNNGIWGTNTVNLNIINLIVANSIENDFNLTYDSQAITINTTFDGNKVFVDENSSLTIKNFLDIKVIDVQESPISGADALVKDNDLEIYKSFGYGGDDPQTDANGMIKWILVTDRIYNGSCIATENITKVSVKYGGWEEADREVNMSTSHEEVFQADE